jgi:ketosteroid isomerase-like protein
MSDDVQPPYRPADRRSTRAAGNPKTAWRWWHLVEALVIGLLGLAMGVTVGWTTHQFASNPDLDTSQHPAINRLLNSQQLAWDRGDLDGFMEGYWNSPDLTFRSGGTITRGYAETLERYRKKYQAPGAEMGTLRFSDVDVTILGGSAIVTGRWTLNRTADTPTGLFTLRLKYTLDGNGWKIVDDHTSAVEPTPLKKK